MADGALPTNLLYPSIRLFVRGDVSGKTQLPLQEHAYRIANEPNTFFYVLPKITGAEVAVFVRNLDKRDVALVQRCQGIEGADVRCECPALTEVELPTRLIDCGDGVDILDSDMKEVLMRLRFDGKPIPPDFVPHQHTKTGWTPTNANLVDLQHLLFRLKYNV